LIVAGRDPGPLDPLVRTQDLFSLLTGLAGRAVPASGPLGTDEVLLSESYFRTYRQGHYKSIRSRVTDRLVLVDVERDPQESHDIAAKHPDIVRAHRERVDDLTRELGVSGVDAAPISEKMIRRLRDLGYLGE
jgi:hypothetical protein